jgi:hypothetical protein
MACDTGHLPMNQKVPNIGLVLSLTVYTCIMHSLQSVVISPLYMRQLWAQSTVRSKSINGKCTVRSAQSAVVVLHRGKGREKEKRKTSVHNKKMNCTWVSVTGTPSIRTGFDCHSAPEHALFFAFFSLLLRAFLSFIFFMDFTLFQPVPGCAGGYAFLDSFVTWSHLTC